MDSRQDPPCAAALLLSDLHLPVGASPYRERFLAFLQGPARSTERLYILGDLFEYWIGDDAGVRLYAAECAALRACTAAGTDVAFMHGNRDFLVGQRFAAATGVRLLHDPSKVAIGGVTTLLSHGDVFCTEDLAYQRWRRFARNGLARALFLRLPQGLRARIAGGLRQASGEAQRAKARDIADVSLQAVELAMRGSDCRRLIHGHTHRPARHRLSTGAERLVLADWTPRRCEYLRADSAGCRRIAC